MTEPVVPDLHHLRTEVLIWLDRNPGVAPIIHSDLEDAGVGGRCPWKRLGELAEQGHLEVTGRRPGRYGRTCKEYRPVDNGA